MKTLLIDDLRNEAFISQTYGIEVTEVARTYTDGVNALVTKQWDLLLLDHDLNSYVDGVEKTGYDIIVFLENNPQYMPKEIFLVTANPVGRARMQFVIDSWKRTGLLK